MFPRINIIRLLCYVLCMYSVMPWIRSELYSAISEVVQLLETHQRVIDDLDRYIKLEENRLLILKTNLNNYKREQDKAMGNRTKYLENPINAFTLIKRLTTDLDAIEKRIKSCTEYMKNMRIYHKDVKYPNAEDLTGAAHALIRLQETYRLNVHDLAEGILRGIVYSPDGCMLQETVLSTPMTTSDCFELARALYSDKDYKNALPWFLEALRKFREENEISYFDEVDILDYIGFSHFLLGDVKGALDWTKKLLEIEPNYPRARGNISYYEEAIKEEAILNGIFNYVIGAAWDFLETLEEEFTEEPTEYPMLKKRYEQLCRGEMELPAEYSKRLFCRYLTENHPFLKLARVKMEYVYRDPDVIVFHQVLSDDEIEFIQDKSKPRFKRATVYNDKTGGAPSNYRISKVAWLRDEESPVVATVSQRVADITGLSIATAEPLQVLNYGIGGQYEPHYDFHNKGVVDVQRIATVLFYMSEVAQGGATVFTRLGLSVFPQKGAALFWMNLHPSGEGDLSTRHAACPVLRGSKWAFTKWIHETGQEFLRPCNLEFQDENYLHQIPKAIPKTSR